MIEKLKESGLFSEITELDEGFSVFISADKVPLITKANIVEYQVYAIALKIKEIIGDNHIVDNKDENFPFRYSRGEGFSFLVI